MNWGMRVLQHECVKSCYRILWKFKDNKGKNKGTNLPCFYRGFAAWAVPNGSDGQRNRPLLLFHAEDGQTVLNIRCTCEPFKAVTAR